MRDDEQDSETDDPAVGSTDGVRGAGLCNSCVWQRVVTSGRGSTFSMCRRSAEDPRFRRYPPLPVLSCGGFEPADRS
jgi:hypothetical protein